MPNKATRALSAFTWHGAAVLLGFCALYGFLLSRNAATGWSTPSILEYLAGVAAAIAVFAPPFVLGVLMAPFAPRRIGPRAFVLAAAVALGVALGYELMRALQHALATWHLAPTGHVGSPLPLVLIAWLGLAVHLFRERERDAEQALHDERERDLDLRRRMSEAELQVLQSQIEPHFLFNSLAHVRRLYQIDPRAGRDMLRHLRDYIGAALPAMREPSIGLDRDLQLAIAYLNIQRIRMGARLQFDVDVPMRMRSAQVPPMMVTTLVENAIKHGLSPLPEGGAVRIVAGLEGDRFGLHVSDTGQGFQSTLGSGVGLANIQARLMVLYGRAAKLSLSRNEPRGVTASVTMPFRMEHATS